MSSRAPSELIVLKIVEQEDLSNLQPHEAERVLKKIAEWENHIQWDRDPAEHLRYISNTPPEYNFYRQQVGNDKFRIIYLISEDKMFVVAVLKRHEHTYDDLEKLVRRAKQYIPA